MTPQCAKNNCRVCGSAGKSAVVMHSVVGIDEVGRGSWAGPLVAAAVILNEAIDGLTDSKLLTKKRREKLAEMVKQTADYGIGWVWPTQIDQIGLTAAVSLAMAEALSQIKGRYDEVIIDGNYNYIAGNPKVKTLIKADLVIPSVSAASIIAKVARDEYMSQQAGLFPNYGFDKHVGYGTKLHIEALKQFGICELHRLSYKPIQTLV